MMKEAMFPLAQILSPRLQEGEEEESHQENHMNAYSKAIWTPVIQVKEEILDDDKLRAKHIRDVPPLAPELEKSKLSSSLSKSVSKGT